MTRKHSSFRHWLQEMYYNNCEENIAFSLPVYQMREYVNKYRWWLKREYRRQLTHKSI